MGIIGRPQGLRGELRVHLLEIGPAEIDRLTTDRLFLHRAQETPSREVRLAGFRFQKGVWIVALEGIEDREAAERLGGAILAIPAAELWPTGENEYFAFELVGLEAVEQGSGACLGEVTGVQDAAGNDLLVILHPRGHSFLVPLNERFVRKIDLQARRLWLELPEGLIELNE